jgi:hypothetical protein
MAFTTADVAKLLVTLRNSLREDVLPILHVCMGREEGGYFIIPREVFAYTDFLGALYGGYGGEMDGRHRRLATTDKAVKFIEDIFAKADPLYGRYGRHVHEMFRHGTVHVFRPHALRRPDGSTLEWKIHKGPRREFQIDYEGRQMRVNHLEPIVIDAPSRRHILPLSISALYEDLLSAIDVYESELNSGLTRGDPTLLNNYGQTMDALRQPEGTSLTW